MKKNATLIIATLLLAVLLAVSACDARTILAKDKRVTIEAADGWKSIPADTPVRILFLTKDKGKNFAMLTIDKISYPASDKAVIQKREKASATEISRMLLSYTKKDGTISKTKEGKTPIISKQAGTLSFIKKNKQANVDIWMKQYLFFKKNMYLITVSSSVKNAAKFEPEFDKMAESIKFTEPPPPKEVRVKKTLIK